MVSMFGNFTSEVIAGDVFLRVTKLGACLMKLGYDVRDVGGLRLQIFHLWILVYEQEASTSPTMKHFSDPLSLCFGFDLLKEPIVLFIFPSRMQSSYRGGASFIANGFVSTFIFTLFRWLKLWLSLADKFQDAACCAICFIWTWGTWWLCRLALEVLLSLWELLRHTCFDLLLVLARWRIDRAWLVWWRNAAFQAWLDKISHVMNGA